MEDIEMNNTNRGRIVVNYDNTDAILTLSDKTPKKSSKYKKLLTLPGITLTSTEDDGDIVYYEIVRDEVLESKNLCKELTKEYIKHYIDTRAHAILELRLKDNTLVGYALITFDTGIKYNAKDKTAMYIPLICGYDKYKNVGSHLLYIINRIAKRLDYEKINLHSTTEALEFYLKKGFLCENEECNLEFEVNTDRGKNTKIRGSRVYNLTKKGGTRKHKK